MATNSDVIRDGTAIEPPIAPFDDSLKATLGRSFPVLNEALTALSAIHREIEPEWKFSPRAGWYQAWYLHGRKLFNLLPQSGEFQVSVVLGDHALAALEESTYHDEVTRMLHSATHSAEGTVLTFAADDYDAPAVLALFEAKIAA